MGRFCYPRSVIWQDIVIAVIVLVFAWTTIPMILQNTILPKSTTLPMTAGTAILAGTYATLELWYSFGVEMVATSLWLILLYRSATLRTQ